MNSRGHVINLETGMIYTYAETRKRNMYNSGARSKYGYRFELTKEKCVEFFEYFQGIQRKVNGYENRNVETHTC